MKHLFPFLFMSLPLFFTSCKEKTNTDHDADGMAADTTASSAIDAGADGTYVIDTLSSQIKWKGSKPTGEHNGTVPVSGGTITVAGGNITSANIDIDMTGITVLDLEGDMKKNLESHLKGKDPGKEEDFFNVDKFPKATYVVNSVSRLDNDPEGTHMVNGTLTIKDISKPVNFKANINVNNGKLTAVTPEFAIDRTEYDIRFKSRKFFNNLQDDFVNDEFKLQITVNANKQ